MSDDDLPYTDSGIFNDRYLTKKLPQRPEWDCNDDAQEALQRLKRLYEDEYESVSADTDSESTTISDWIEPIIEILGYDEREEVTFPEESGEIDKVLFDSATDRRKAGTYENSQDYQGLYDRALTILEAKSWDTDFSKKFSDDRNYFNASEQINFYLSYMPKNTVRWGILTDGKTWRLYGTYHHQSFIFYQIDDLPELITNDNLEHFKYFYVLFRKEAFRRKVGDCFLDTIYRESEELAVDIGDDLQNNVFKALATIAEGFIETNDLTVGNDGIIDPVSLNMTVPKDDEVTLDDLREQSLVYLYRLMFLFYAEAKGLLEPATDQGTRTYQAELSLDELRDQITKYADSPEEVRATYLRDSTTQWNRLHTFFEYIDQGQSEIGIQAYNGGLFDTDEHRFLANHPVSNQHLSEVIFLLSTTATDLGPRTEYDVVSYKGLKTRHLGSIYEGLLQHQFRIADTDKLAVIEDAGDDQEWIDADKNKSKHTVVDSVESGDLYLTTDNDERKISGSFYTPKYIVDYILDWNIGPKIDQIESELAEDDLERGTAEYVHQFRSKVLDLNILDPAMGSGHFLTRTTLYLADEINKRVREADELAGQAIAEENGGSNGETHTDGGSVTGTDTGDVSIEKFTEIQLRRDIAKECIFGVDRNSVAVELAKLSLWLETLAAEQPLAFLDHHLKQGDSLLGSDIEEIQGLEGTGRDEEQTTLAPIDRLEEVIEKLVDVFNDLVAIPNETLDDAREMKRIYYEEIQEDTLYRRFHQLANVDLSDSLGLDWAQESAFDRSGIQADAYQYMAGNLESDEHWEGEKIDETVTSKPWFKSAQAQAEQLSFFHWKLEFPEVYYGVGADDSSKAGFDAIVGNPPWLGTRTGGIPDDVSDFFKRQYGMSGQSDLAEGFLNRCLQLGGQDCSVGMVVPKNIASNEEFEDLRKNITADETLNYAIDFGVAFEGVNTDAMVLGINADPGATSVIVGECSGEAQLETRPVKLDLIDAMPFHIFPVNSRNEDIELVKKINEKKTGTLGEEVSISRGLEIGMNDSSISSTKSNNSLALVDHRDVHKHAIDYSGHYLDLDKIDDGDLKDTGLFTTTPKILIRYLNSDIVAGRDDVGYASTNLVHHVQVNGYLDYLMAQVDSALISFWYKHAFQSEEVKFPKVQKSHIESLPIVLPDSGQESDINNRLLGETDDRKIPAPVSETISDSSEPPWVAVRSDIEDRVATIIDKKESRFDLDIELNDYIPMDAGTVKLGDLGVLNQTIAGDSAIRDTAVDYRDGKLQIDDISTSVKGNTLTVSASVRYKPMDTNEFEITNGYVEEDTEEVFKIHNLETEQAEFTAAFISMINENHNDVRGFYKNATKNISLLDRLTEYLLVPEYSQWESEWNRYLKARDYHNRLEKEIHENDSVIDTYFAIIFELNQSEIEHIKN